MAFGKCERAPELLRGTFTQDKADAARHSPFFVFYGIADA